MTEQQSDRTPPGSDYRTDFLKILNNQSRGGKIGQEIRQEGADKPRQRGFVVLVRGGSNLKPIQSLCFDEKQTYNHCLTARYRLQPGAALGTLMAALVVDLDRIARGQKDVDGDMAPALSDDVPGGELRSWPRWAPTYLTGLPAGLISKLSIASPEARVKQGTLTHEELQVMLEQLHNESVLSTGQRLVLLGEISEEDKDLTEWQSAMNTLLTRLPERVGIVLSGAPKDFALPTDNPHFLEITLPKEDDTATKAQGNIAYRYTDSSFHRDEPARKDELGVNEYANAIARFILHPQTQPPLTVGIHGPWGKGKSSFMRLVESALIKYAKSNRNVKRKELNGETRLQRWNDLVAKLTSFDAQLERSAVDHAPEPPTWIDDWTKNKKEEADLWETMTRESGVVSIFFNAWQFEDAKQTWAGLASQISEEMERALPWHSRQWLKVEYAWRERKSELVLGIMFPVALVGFVAGLIILGFFRDVIPPDKIDTPLGSLLKLLLPTSSALFTLWLVSSQLIKVAQPISERVLSYVRLPNYREQMGFQHRVKDDLQFVYEFLKKRRQKTIVVVYIDDLDRCSENKIMEVLQAINLILASCKFFVFVGMDTEMIYRAIKSHYKENVPNRFSENYLRKIIQISFYLPESDQHARMGYLGTLFSAAARLELESRSNASEVRDQGQGESAAGKDGSLHYDLGGVLKIVPVQLKEAEDTVDELQTFVDYSDFLDDNPREIKRLINIHRLIKILLQKRDTSWPGERQRKLVKWLIFCDTWPDLVDDVLDDKKLFLSRNCLGDLADRLDELTKNPMSTERPPNFDRLSEFARSKKDQNALTGDDIDESFRLAAYLSQLVRKSRALPDSVQNGEEESHAAPDAATQQTTPGKKSASTRRQRTR